MSSAEEALFVVRLPAGAKTVALGKIPELIGIALYEARFGSFDAEAADDEIWQYIHLVAIDYEKALTRAAATGELEVLNDFTLRALPPALVTEKAVVSLPALRKFIATQGGSLLIETHSTARVATNAPPPVTILGQSFGPDLSIKYDLRSPDWNRWARLDVVRLWEAACLAANIEPPTGKANAIWAEYELKTLPSEFHAIWEAVNCDESLSKLEVLPNSGRMLWRVHLVGFSEWALSKGFELPVEMRTIAKLAPAKGGIMPTDSLPVQNTGADTGAIFGKHVSKLESQRRLILQWLIDNNFDPKDLPARQQGKGGPKSAARSAMLKKSAMFTPRSFEKAWESLRADESILGAD